VSHSTKTGKGRDALAKASARPSTEAVDDERIVGRDPKGDPLGQRARSAELGRAHEVEGDQNVA
jgi:hypothetical protein